jgi:WD40 repeat protein
VGGDILADAGNEVLQMQEGVHGWVQRIAGRGGRGLRSASPLILLSLLCASAFCPLLMATGVAGAGVGVLSSVGGGFLTQVISDALDRLRRNGQARPSRDDLEKGIAQQIARVLAAGDERANALRSEIASVLKQIDAGGTALRAAMEQSNERVRGDVLAAVGVLGSDFEEMGFLIKDVARAAEEIQKSLDVQGADVRVIIEQNARQSTEIRLVREDLAVIAGQARSAQPGTGRGDGVAHWVRGCPYRGLLPFGESDAQVFYGRERLAAELAVKLAARVTRGGLVIVTGASGAGKTSLLRAGLLPILARGRQVQDSDQWAPIVMTPTKDPLTEFAARLAALGGNDTIAVRDRLAQHPGQAHLAIWSAGLANAARQGEARLVSRESAARVMLIVDQFEQVFTLSPGPRGEASRRAFITALCAAATSPVGPKQEPPALVVIAVRGDFWDQCAAYSGLVAAMQDGQFVVGPMTESELRVAITGPADAAGLEIDPGLIDTILSDVRAAAGEGAAGVLPLLSQAMSLTWEKREGERLTNRGYSQAGGVSHAVQTGADKVFDALSPAQQVLARDVLRGMTAAGREGRFTRRPLTRADLYSALPSADQSQVDAVLEAFAAERLIVLNEDMAQISHDVLLRAWPKLRGWLEEDQASWILYGQLADSAGAWQGNGNDPSFLYRGAQLTTAQQAVTRWSANPGRYPSLNGTERNFLLACGRAAARSSRQRRAAVGVLVVLTLLASVASIFAFQLRSTALGQRDQAIANRDQAIYNQVRYEALQLGYSDPSLAAQLNLAAYRGEPTRDVESRLLSTENTPLSASLAGAPGPVYSVAFSPDGHALASTGYAGTPRLWDVTDHAHPRLLKQPSARAGLVYSVAFSPDSHVLADVTKDGSVQLWNLAAPADPRPLGSPLANTGQVYSVAFSPDGHTLATGSYSAAGQTVRLWNVTNPAFPKRLGGPLPGSPVGETIQVLFSPDGRTLTAQIAPHGNAQAVMQLWDITDPARPRPLGQPIPTGGLAFNSATFSPDSRILAIPDPDEVSVQLWNVANPRHSQFVRNLDPNVGNVYSTAFSPDGRILATAGQNGAIQLWNMVDQTQPEPLGQQLNDPSGIIYSIAFSPDGRSLAAGNADGTIRLWSLPRTILIGHVGPVYSAAFSPDGRVLASGGYDGTVRLWDMGSPANPRALGQSLSSGVTVRSVAFRPDGRVLASGLDNGTVRLWDVANPANPRTLGRTVTNTSAGPVYSVAFSPDGRVLATADYDGTIGLWDVADPAHPRELGQPLDEGGATVFSVTFTRNGRMLAAGGGNSGTVGLWNVADPARPRVISKLHVCNTGIVRSVAFSQASSVLAGACDDGTVGLWNVANPAHPAAFGEPLTGQVGQVYSVAFSSDSHTLASAGNDGTIGLWDVADPAHPVALGEPLTADNYHLYAVAFRSDDSTLATATGDATIQLWNLRLSYAIQHICTTSSHILTPRLWPKYVTQLTYQAPCTH